MHHVVNHIIAPFGEPIEERAPVPSQAERIEFEREKKARKDERRRARKVGEEGVEGKVEEEGVKA